MTPLPQLVLAGYSPGEWDLKADAEGRAYWLGLFRWHLDAVLIPLIQAEFQPTPAALAAYRADYLATYARVETAPESFDTVDVMLLTLVREDVDERHGFRDPFCGVKQRANEAALALLRGVLADVDRTSAAERWEMLVRGLLAGNIFDLGSRASIERHWAGENAFHDTLGDLPPRPWLCDDLTAWNAAHAGGAAPRHAVFFVDNAGSDFVLGCLPFVRELLRGGTRVTLAANSAPALNDITAAELPDVLARAAALDGVLDAALRDGALTSRATGSRSTLIDLAHLADDFTRAVADADLILLHGMGRAIESNFSARFSCAATWSAILKDERVAARHGGRVLDCVFRATGAAPRGR